jgi:hypothetical protein
VFENKVCLLEILGTCQEEEGPLKSGDSFGDPFDRGSVFDAEEEMKERVGESLGFLGRKE